MPSPIVTTEDTFKALQALTGTGSAYAVANMMGVSRVTAGYWRTGKVVIDDAHALKAATLLGWDADHVLACLAAERAARAGSDETAAVWRHVALRLATAASVVFLGVYSVFLIHGPVL